MLSVQSRSLYDVSLFTAPTKFYAKMLSMIQDFWRGEKDQFDHCYWCFDICILNQLVTNMLTTYTLEVLQKLNSKCIRIISKE